MVPEDPAVPWMLNGVQVYSPWISLVTWNVGTDTERERGEMGGDGGKMGLASDVARCTRRLVQWATHFFEEEGIIPHDDDVGDLGRVEDALALGPRDELLGRVGLHVASDDAL